MYFDSTFLLLIPGILLALWAQMRVKGTYEKYSKVISNFPGSAAQAAQKILDDSGNDRVRVQPTQGMLTDHYDPRNETLNLSEGVYSSNSVAALGIAAHEAGHAMQKKDGYALLNLRTAVVPVVNIGSSLSLPIFILGFALSFEPLVTIGIILFSLTVVFALITLPVEFNASKRAVEMLSNSGIITSQQEEQGVKKVLNAAAMTYVAAAVSAILQLVRLILLRRRND
jgi:hypothetical protein